ERIGNEERADVEIGLGHASDPARAPVEDHHDRPRSFLSPHRRRDAPHRDADAADRFETPRQYEKVSGPGRHHATASLAASRSSTNSSTRSATVLQAPTSRSSRAAIDGRSHVRPSAASIAAASAAASSTGTIAPLTSFSTKWALSPAPVVTTGAPHASASSTALQQPSRAVASANTSAALSQPATSAGGTLPTRRTACPTPSLPASASRSSGYRRSNARAPMIASLAAGRLFA